MIGRDPLGSLGPELEPGSSGARPPITSAYERIRGSQSSGVSVNNRGAGGIAELNGRAAASDSPPAGGRSLVFRLIAAERLVRGLVLVIVGAILLTHQHTDWGAKVRRWAQDLGLDPSRHVVATVIARVHAFGAHQILILGLVALGVGALESVEGVGLWLALRWAEYLTVIATSALIPFELWELARHPSALKLGGLVVSIAIIGYLVWALRRSHPRAASEAPTRPAPSQQGSQPGPGR